eukprot:151333_1
MPVQEYDLFHIGDIVQIVGLKTRKYNGELAEIAGPFLIDTKRWPVQLKNENQDKIAVKSINIQRLMPSSYKPSYSSGIYGLYYTHQSDVEEDTAKPTYQYMMDDDDQPIPYATAEDFKDYFIEEDDDDDEDEKESISASDKSISENDPTRHAKKRVNNSMELQALREKYSTRKVVLPEKSKTRTPQCISCDGFYHIQSDPFSAYDEVGIICELCGKNRQDNPELLLEDHYYKCETCENVDICCKCYEKEKEKLMLKKSPT